VHRLRERYIKLLLKLASSKRSAFFKAVALATDGLVYLVAVPWILFRLAAMADRWIPLCWPSLLESTLSILGLFVGFFWIGWSVWTQLALGKGTPNFSAPPRRLIVEGPFRLCRNPLQFGVMLYYLGLGALVRNTTVGLTAFLAALIAGSLYHRYVEEEELKRRFGAEYETYRKRTPFLIPRWRQVVGKAH